jgi:hypothetical protein
MQPLWQSSLRKIEINEVGDAILLISRQDDTVRSLSRMSGSLLWERRVPMAQGRLFPYNQPSEVDYTLDGTQMLVFGNKQMTALSVRTGEVLDSIPYAEWGSLHLDTDRGVFLKLEEDKSLSCKPVGANEAVSRAAGRPLPEFKTLYIGLNLLFLLGSDSVHAMEYPCPSKIRPALAEGHDGLVDYIDHYQVLLEYMSTM